MTDDTPELEDNRRTRKAARDEAHAAALVLAVRLGEVKDEWFELLPLDANPRVGDQLRLGRGLKPSGAKKRIIAHVARLLKDVDMEPILDALEQLELGHEVETESFHAAEEWRDRIVAEGDEAIDEFVAAHPTADRQRLRQLARQAAKEAAKKATPKASRAIFKLVRADLEAPDSED